MSKALYKELYINEKQAEVLNATQNVVIFQAGRGTGKTTIRGDRFVLLFKEMPRSKGFLLGKTFKMIENNFLPEIFDRMAQYGFKEHISPNNPGHYVVNKKPPAHWWKPYKAPRNYDNMVSFINGMCIYLMSFDRPDTVRGGSFDWGDVDEASLLDYGVFKKTVLPLMRGNVGRFKSDYHKSLLITGSMPWTAKGEWLITTMPELAEKYPNEYKFIQASALDNKAVLGPGYFQRMKEMMDPVTYEVEILNQKPEKLPNGFYEMLQDKHTYTPVYDNEADYSNSFIDVDATRPLEVSFDFNAAFNSCIIAQDLSTETRIIDALYVKNKMMDHLVDDICRKYAWFANKYVYIYGGKDGTKRNANSDITYYQQIQNRFREHGWHSEVRTELGLSDSDHKVKHMVINTVLAEHSEHVQPVRIHEERCSDLLFSLRNSPILPDFKKDKSSEKADIPQERATHLSDCFDNLIYPKFHLAIKHGPSDYSGYSFGN
jgi:hypothetical protein